MNKSYEQWTQAINKSCENNFWMKVVKKGVNKSCDQKPIRTVRTIRVVSRMVRRVRIVIRRWGRLLGNHDDHHRTVTIPSKELLTLYPRGGDDECSLYVMIWSFLTFLKNYETYNNERKLQVLASNSKFSINRFR